MITINDVEEKEHVNDEQLLKRIYRSKGLKQKQSY